jgi:L-alanine-DL-glutamate epimerase-like enolase superfamily enzyme
VSQGRHISHCESPNRCQDRMSPHHTRRGRAANPLMAFQSRLFKGPILREERTEDGVFLIPPTAPGLGLEVDEVVAAEYLVRE